jgi:hypothetical protein
MNYEKRLKFEVKKSDKCRKNNYYFFFILVALPCLDTRELKFIRVTTPLSSTPFTRAVIPP